MEPNFFIIGAAKCGTTSLARWLGDHQRVFVSDPKEPHYFSTDINATSELSQTWSDYMRLFDKAGQSHMAIGEASVRYIYSQVAVQNILKRIPSARFIVCLRNPIEMAYSLFCQRLVEGIENEACFARAWTQQSDRAAGVGVPALCSDPKLLLYGEQCALGSQLKRLYATVSRDAVHIIFLKDMARDPRRVYQGVLDFLGVPDDGRASFPAYNPGSERRSMWLQRMLKRSIAIRREIGLPPLRLGLGEWLNRINRKPRNKPAMSDEMRSRLEVHFQGEVSLLESLTGRVL